MNENSRWRNTLKQASALCSWVSFLASPSLQGAWPKSCAQETDIKLSVVLGAGILGRKNTEELEGCWELYRGEATSN